MDFRKKLSKWFIGMSLGAMLSTTIGLRGLCCYRKIFIKKGARGEIPDCVATGWTVLLLKNKNTENELSNCLLTYVELVTSIVADEIKSCCKNSRGRKGQLLIEKQS